MTIDEHFNGRDTIYLGTVDGRLVVSSTADQIDLLDLLEFLRIDRPDLLKLAKLKGAE